MTARTLTIAFLLSLLVPARLSAQQATEGPHMLDLPILVAACERDPGNQLQPGGGRFSPQQVMEDHDCEPVADVSVTVSNRDIGFFARCETDDEGMCRVGAPTDPERELMVAVHVSTVPPGYVPVENVTPTVHYTEFTGEGIVLLADPDAAPGDRAELPDRRTLAVHVERDGEPIGVLTQLSAGEVTIDEFPWLATNDEGWVSYDLGQFDTDMVDLMLDMEGEPRIVCRDIDNDVPLETQFYEGREGEFARITLPDTDGDINCDVTLPSQ